MSTIPEGDIPKLRKLYNTRKLSAREIAEKFDVPLDAIYYAMRKYNIERRSRSDTNRILFENKPLSFRIRTKLTREEELLKLAGVMLYWSEGYKTEKSTTVDFANSDVEMMRVFIHFLRHICGIDETRLRIYLYCHNEDYAESLMRFWSKQLRVSRNQFTKPYVRKHAGVEKKNKMPYGLVHIRYADKKLLKEILGWIEIYKEQFRVGTQAVNGGGL